MAKSAMPDLEIGRHVRLSCSKPEALEANITGHAEDSAQWHRVATRALESRANRGHQPAHGLGKSIALASADRKAGLVISMILTSAGFSNFTFRLAWNTLLNICFSCFITPEDHNPLSVARQSVCSHHHHHHHHQHSTNVYS